MNPRAGAAAAALLASLALPAHAGDEAVVDRYYAGVHLGAHGLSSWPATVDFGGVAVDGAAALGHGLHGGLQFGRRTEHARFELEWQQGTLPVHGVTLGAVNEAADARGRYRALTVGASRLIELDAKWNAFVGAGIGRGKVTLPQVPLSNGCHCFAEADAGGTTYLLRAGIEARTASAWRPWIALTWLRLPGAASEGTPGIRYARRELGALSAGVSVAF